MPDEQNHVESFNHILLIEDNPGDARLVELLLGESDLLHCKIDNRTTLNDGLAALAEGNYAAILLDLTLPDSRGFETLERLLEKYPDNNVIVLTGLSDKSLGINAVKAGAQDFLIKGAFDAELLAKSLRYSIERNSVLKRLEETQRIAHIGNWVLDAHHCEFTASDEIYRIFGYTPRKTVFTYEDIQDPNHPFHVFCILKEQMMPEGKLNKDIEVHREDGTRRYAFIECKLQTSINGKVVIHGIVQDITNRKLAEQAMIKSQERYQEVFTQSKDAIYICTFDGHFIDFNDSTAELFGYSRAELAEMDVHQLYVPDERRDLFLELLRSQKVVKDFEFTIRRKDGHERHCVITATIPESSDLEGYNAVLRDLTEQKQAEELRKARDVAERSAKMKEQFIASISHEMRTPMNAVLGMSNLVIQTDLNEEQHNYISSIKQSSEILLGIINDILEISTLENGKIVFENKAFELPMLLDNMEKVMRYKIKEKDLDFQLDISPEVCPVLIGDKLRLNQILYNLVGNAVKFTDAGFVRVRVRLLTETKDWVRLRFEVQDSGIGIPEDKLGAVFDTFTRIRQKERLYEGTGLGLSIAKNLVAQQGGEIGATSVLREGSTFFFELPFQKGEASQTVVSPAVEENLEVDQDRPIRLLLVEDHKMNQMVARKTLERKWNDIQVTIADNGKIATEILEKELFDIILMDIQMPIMDGYETTEYIRTHMPPAVAAIPILAMTAHAHISKDQKFRQYGMDDFVLKPFEPKQLFQKIVKYVNRNNKTDE